METFKMAVDLPSIGHSNKITLKTRWYFKRIMSYISFSTGLS